MFRQDPGIAAWLMDTSDSSQRSCLAFVVADMTDQHSVTQVQMPPTPSDFQRSIQRIVGLSWSSPDSFSRDQHWDSSRDPWHARNSKPAPLPLISQQKQIRENNKEMGKQRSVKHRSPSELTRSIACFVSTQGACDQCVSVQHAAT